MSSNTLYAWYQGTELGRFEYLDTRTEYLGIPFSLSFLPGGLPIAPYNWLEGVIPENTYVWDKLGYSPEKHWFPFLKKAGSDLPGAISLFSDGIKPPYVEETHVVSEDSILDVVNKSRLGFFTHEEVMSVRISIAGVQKKFALSLTDYGWVLPTYSVPSTHIFKPAVSPTDITPFVEHKTLELAKLVGVPSSDSRIVSSCLVVARFDRVKLKGEVVRVHMEDLTQAMGRPASAKFSILPKEIIKRFLALGYEDLAYQFLEQLAFNTHIGNTDAHAKNYSLFLDPGSGKADMTPLYDAMPVALHGKKTLVMPIGSTRVPSKVTGGDWSMLAKDCGLSLNKVRSIVYRVVGGIHLHYKDVELPEEILEFSKGLLE